MKKNNQMMKTATLVAFIALSLFAISQSAYAQSKSAISLKPDAATIVAAEGVKPMKAEGPQGERNLGFWMDARCYATWTVSFPKAGTYAVEMFAVSKDGSPITLSVGQETVKADIAGAGNWKEYTIVDLGKIKVEKEGEVTVILKAGAGNWKPINIREITFTPKKK